MATSDNATFGHTQLLSTMATQPIKNLGTAVIYDTGTTTYRMSYKTFKTVADHIEMQLKRAHCDSDGGFVGVVVEQNEMFPAVLQGILQAGMGFYCMTVETDFSDAEELRTLQMLKVRLVIAQDGVDLPIFPDVKVMDFGITEPTSTKLRLLKLDSTQASSVQYSFFFNNEDHHRGTFTMMPCEWAYAIRTSGTTSSRKLVLVSHRSITPNIVDFVQTFKLGRKDVIFGASPPTFDPNVIDVFTALKAGGTILYTTKAIKLIPEKLTSLCCKHGVTFIQCTPSFFYRFDTAEATNFVMSNMHLRFIAFGGEPCPKREYLRNVIPPHRRPTLLIYNLYGTTELSCWASVDLVTLKNSDSREIGILQTLIYDTSYRLVDTDDPNEKEILLGTRNRRCLILNCENGQVDPPELIDDDKTTFKRTGDVIDATELPKLVYKGRTDNKMKRHGHFVDLQDLEQRLASIPAVESVFCFGDFGKIYAVLTLTTANFSSTSSESNLYTSQLFSEIERRVPIRSLPNHVIILHPKEIPLTANGKFDLKGLKRLILDKKIGVAEKQKLQVQVDDVEFILENAWHIYTSSASASPNNQELLEQNFIEAGGDSVKAMQLTEYVFQELNLFGTFLQQHHSPELLRILVRSKYSNLIDYVRNQILPAANYNVAVSSFAEEDLDAGTTQNSRDDAEPCYSSTELLLKVDTSEPADVENCDTSGFLPYSHQLAYNLYGCVDATPVLVTHPILGKIVIGTSNSGYVIAVKSQSSMKFQNPGASMLWWKKFPDRIVASAASSRDQLTVFIACCDCRLYAAEVETGSIKWTYFCGGVLLTCPVVVHDVVIVSADTGWIFAVDQSLGTLRWKSEIPKLKSSLAPHLFCDQLLVATEEGISSINSTTGSISSTFQLKTVCTNFAGDRGPVLCVGSVEEVSSSNFLHVLRLLSNKFEEVWRVQTDGMVHTPAFYCHRTQCISFLCLVYITSTGKLVILRQAQTCVVYNELELGVPVACPPAFLEVDGTTYVVTISKDTRRQNTIEFILVRVPRDVYSAKLNDPPEVLTFYSPHDAPILSSILIDDECVVFGRRDDRLYFVNLGHRIRQVQDKKQEMTN